MGKSGSHLALPNVADGLYAIKQAVFEKKLCTANELISALKANYEGYEHLQAKLKALPKYGTDNDEVDLLAVGYFSIFRICIFHIKLGGAVKGNRLF